MRDEINIEEGQSLFNKNMKSSPYAEPCWVYSLFNYAAEHGAAVSQGATLNILVFNFAITVCTLQKKSLTVFGASIQTRRGGKCYLSVILAVLTFTLTCNIGYIQRQLPEYYLSWVLN